MKMHLNVTGRVQGVGFRYTTYQLAVEIGLTGTVKNEEEPHVVYGLPEGTYILYEELPPYAEGYVSAEDIEFEVKEDGSVTIEAVGTKEQMTEFLEKIKKPQNPFAKVSHVEQYEDPTIKDYDQFNVVY